MPRENSGAAHRRGDLLAIVALALGGLAILAVISKPYWSRVALGHTDFLSFYASGRLAFDPGLYEPQRTVAEQIRAAQVISEGTYFIRMPWFAAAMWPLARLPYVPAQLIWQGLLVAGLIAFAVFWPHPSPGIRAVILCFSMPAMMCILMGQDVPILVAWMGLSLALVNRGKPVIGGLVLSLTLAKFHLFLPLFPAVLFARRWRFAAGLFGGTFALIAASFLVSGPDWPLRFITALKDPAITPTIGTSPSFYYVIQGTPAVRDLLIAAIGATLMIPYLCIARLDTEFLIAAAPAVILPLLPHAGAYDCLILAPLAMTALGCGTKWAKIAGLLMILPPTYMVGWGVPSWSVLIPILDVALLALCALPQFSSAGLSTFQPSALPAAPAHTD